jgi:hypothetical protein
MRPQLDGQTKVLQRLLGRGPTQRARFDLLVFWGRFPGGWYSHAAIGPVTRSPRRDIDHALEELVAEGIVDAHPDAAGTYYSVTTSPLMLDVIKQLGRLTPNERRALLSRIAPRISCDGAAAQASVPSDEVVEA